MVQVQQFGTGTRYDLKILHQCGKSVKLKVRKFWRLRPTFVEVTGKKLVGGDFLLPLTPPPPSPILNRVKEIFLKK